MKTFILAVFAFFIMCAVVFAQDITVENPKIKIVIARSGGKIKEMRMKTVNLNPLHSIMHFLCFDRWGPGDDALGIPFHGEANGQTWTVHKTPEEQENYIYTEMSCALPIARLSLLRKIYMEKDEAAYKVVEEITSQNSNERMFNLIQHVTIGGQFLDDNTVVDTKAGRGFSQDGTIPPAGNDVFEWPDAVVWGQTLDVRKYNSGTAPENYVVSYEFQEGAEYGWVTAVNKNRQLLMGYVFSVTDYPWMNIWSSTQNSARGLEFGTTGLHKTFNEILAVGTIFDTQLEEYIDSDDTVVKTYHAFMAQIPGDYKGVEMVELDADKITITEYDEDPDRDIVIPLYTDEVGVNGRSRSVHDGRFDVTAESDGNFTVRYSLAASGSVKLALYDMLGKQVRTLAEGARDAGVHTVQYTTAGMTGGVYLCRLESDGTGALTRNIVIAR